MGNAIAIGAGMAAYALYDKLKAGFKSLLKEIKSWGRGYDSRLKAVQKQFPV